MRGTFNDEGLEYFRSGKEFFMEVRKGNVPGHNMEFVVGQNDTIGTSFEDVSDQGGSLLWPTSAETWEIVSDDVNDTSAGTGVRTVLVNSLDENYIEQSQTVTMNGTTPVTLTGTHIRGRLAVAITAGSTLSNVGNVNVRLAGGTNADTRLMISAANGISKSSSYTTPAGKSAVGLQVSQFVPKNQDVILRVRNTFGIGQPETLTGVTPLYQNSSHNQLFGAPFIGAKSDLRFEAKSDNVNTQVTIFLELLVIDNNLMGLAGT